jgi:hypothetical protein
MSLRALTRSARETEGAVLVIVALMLPVLIGVGGLVVDVGNWFAHKRHLQVQADAGALAGAGKFRYPCVFQPILDEVGKYSSVEGPAGRPSYNPQLSTPVGGLHRMMNSATFYDQSSPVDDTVRAGNPCVAKMIDVKLTETNLPWFLKVAQVKYINAQARVEIRRQTTAKNLIPLGVPNPEPKKARAFFVDESKLPTDAGYVLASTELVRNGSQGLLALWNNAAAPLPVNISVARIGVRVALGDSSTDLTGSYTTVCALPLVKCFDTGTANGLTNIRGWTAGTGSATAALARDVTLFGTTCGDGYFNSLTAACTVGVRATVDIGAGTYGKNASGVVVPKPTGLKVQVMRSDTPNTKYDLTWDTLTGTWVTGASTIPLTAITDKAVTIDIFWSTGCNGGGNSCTKTGTISNVQRTFEGSDLLSGPVALATVSQTGVPGANSFQTATTPSLVVNIGLTGSLAVAQTVNDPKVVLKFEQGGLTGFLDCDPNIGKVEDEIFSGCTPQYAINTGHLCPYAPTPLQCVPVETGNKVGHVGPGLNHRILGDEKPNVCTNKNHWSQFASGLPDGDPRIIQVFITPTGAFDGSGNGTVPIVDFAAFYVTGWEGSGSSHNPCQDLPASDPLHDDTAQKGEIVGHFIKYIDLANPEGASEDVCDFNSLSPCVSLFTR